MNNETIFYIILCSTAALVYIIVIARFIETSRNSIPEGKAFIKEFSKIIENIYLAHKLHNLKSADVVLNNKVFKVSVERVFEYEGFRYSTIPMYESYLICINDEPVCRKHIIRPEYKTKVFLEFSNKREISEIIDIIKAYNITAKNLLVEDADIKHFERKSFYS